MKLFLIGMLALLPLVSMAAPETPDLTAENPAQPGRKTITYSVPWECLHRCDDPMESIQRFSLGSFLTADLYSQTGKGSKQSLKLLARRVLLRELGGLVETKPAELALDVTPEEDKEIKAAIRKNELFVMYYQAMGW